MIDTTERVNARFWRRWLTVGKLREILSELEEGHIIAPNRVGNLAVFKDIEDWEAVGYIDIAGERYEPLV